MTRPAFIAGRTVDLVPLAGDDAEACAAWLNDMDILKDELLRGRGPGC
jgi:hypothetical protein